MARLLLGFLLLSLVQCQLHRDWWKHCGKRSAVGNGLASWFALVRNEETQIDYGAAIISQRHVITVKAAVTKLIDGTESVIDSDNIKVVPIIAINGESETIYDVQRSIIPVKLEHEFDKPILLNLVILEVAADFHKNATFACPVFNGRFPDPPFVNVVGNIELNVVNAGHQSGSVILEKSQFSCNERYCEEFLMKRPSNEAHLGDIWYMKLGVDRSYGYLKDDRGYGYDYVVGIELEEGKALSVAFWSDFICKQTGACKLGIGEMSDRQNANFHYLLDGKLHFDTCSVEEKREMIRRSTPFRRISHTELSMLRRECGRSKNANLLEESASFLVTIMADRVNCTWSRYRQTIDCRHRDIKMCSGVLISPSHVVSSAACLKKIMLNKTTIAVFFTDHQQSDDEEFPFMEASPIDLINCANKEDLTIPHYDTSRVGKRWSLVDRVTTPYTGEATKHDIALLQLGQPIPLDSYIRPICLPPTSRKIPEKLSLVWNREQKDASTSITKRVLQRADVTVSDSCTMPEDCETFTVKAPFSVPSRSAMGSPVFHENNGQKYLEGYLSLDKTGKMIVLRPSYFTSFICLHTGVCEEGESFKSRLFLLYELQNMDTPPYVLMQELNEWKYSNELEWDLMEKEMASVVKKLAENKYKLNRLSPEEYEEVKHECGKIAPQNRIIDGIDFDINQHPWPVTIAYEFDETLITLCGGAFISKRHVITAKHCVMRPRTYLVLYGSVESGKFEAPDLLRAPVKTIAFTDRYEPHIKWHYDLAVLELFENIQLTRQTQMLCIGDSATYKNDAFSPIARVYGGGRGNNNMNARIQYLEYDLATDDPSFIRGIVEESSAVEEFGWYSKEGRGYAIQGDSGGPLVRQRTSDGRFTLYGVSRSVRRNTSIVQVTRMETSLESICKMSGVCPNGEIDPAKMHEISVNGLRLC